MSELSRMPAMNFCAADGRRFERSEPIHDLRSCRRVPTVCFRNFCHALLAALAAWFRPDAGWAAVPNTVSRIPLTGALATKPAR
jgi:hypothetical protein